MWHRNTKWANAVGKNGTNGLAQHGRACHSPSVCKKKKMQYLQVQSSSLPVCAPASVCPELVPAQGWVCRMRFWQRPRDPYRHQLSCTVQSTAGFWIAWRHRACSCSFPGPLISPSGFRDPSTQSAFHVSIFIGNMFMSSACKFWKQVPVLECGEIFYFLIFVSNSSREEYTHVSQISLWGTNGQDHGSNLAERPKFTWSVCVFVFGHPQTQWIRVLGKMPGCVVGKVQVLSTFFRRRSQMSELSFRKLNQVMMSKMVGEKKRWLGSELIVGSVKTELEGGQQWEWVQGGRKGDWWDWVAAWGRVFCAEEGGEWTVRGFGKASLWLWWDWAWECRTWGAARKGHSRESRVPSPSVQGAGGDWHARCCSYKSSKGTKVRGCHYPCGRHGLSDWRLGQVGISETLLVKP